MPKRLLGTEIAFEKNLNLSSMSLGASNFLYYGMMVTLAGMLCC